MAKAYREQARELLKNEKIDEDADYYVYILELCRHDGETFYYSGLTSNVLNRITVHISRKDIYMPSITGEMRKDVKYDVISIIEVIDIYGNRERARNMERLRSFEIAIECETTNVLGGS